MSSDKLMGPKVRIALSKFLPDIFLDAMRKSIEACLQVSTVFFLCDNEIDSQSDDEMSELSVIQKMAFAWR